MKYTINKMMTIRMRTALPLLITLFTLATGCRGTKEVPVVYTPDHIVPTDKSLLWRISGNGLKQPSYLFGTIHIIPKNDLAFSDATKNAIQHCDKMVFEIDIKEMTSLRTQFSLLTKAFMKGGKTLKDLLSEEDYAFVHQKMKDKGMAMGMFERLKPMFLSMMLTNDEGMDVNRPDSKITSVEMELWKIGKKQKMRSGGLESADYQMSVFDKIPYEAQAKMLIEGLRSTSDESGSLEEMIQWYKAEDIEKMHQMIHQEGSGVGEYGDILLNNRNENWIPLMAKAMPEQSIFFAVGAGHLGGKLGVIALLRQKGYRVEAVK